MLIEIQSFNGIGDLLFVTPTLRRLKEAKEELEIIVNTNYPVLLLDNPFVDKIGSARRGIKLNYPDPIHCKEPICHHIISDWKIITEACGIKTEPPDLKPEIYLDLPERGYKVGIQVEHKGQWHGKKVWPYFRELCSDYTMIPHFKHIQDLVSWIASCGLVVCAEGGISHIARAVGTPAIVIYGGFASPFWNGYPEQTNLVNRPDCSFCYNSHPCKGEYKCLKEISVKYVKEVVRIKMQSSVSNIQN